MKGMGIVWLTAAASLLGACSASNQGPAAATPQATGKPAATPQAATPQATGKPAATPQAATSQATGKPAATPQATGKPAVSPLPHAPAGSLQELALDVLHRAHPEWQFTLLDENGVAVHSADQTLNFYLDNIQRDAGSDRRAAERLIVQGLHTLERALTPTESETYESVEARLRPMLVPRDYAAQYGMATRDFVSIVREAIVIDDPNSMRYVMPSDLSKWHVAFDTAAKAAHQGLWRASGNVKIDAQSADDPSVKGKLVTLAFGDGYDAARLSLAEVRDALGAKLGYPFYVGIPNRDFLVAWSKGASFAANFGAQVKSDFASQGHAISPEIYRVDRNGVKAEP